jgi:hypothetical protein
LLPGRKEEKSYHSFMDSYRKDSKCCGQNFINCMKHIQGIFKKKPGKEQNKSFNPKKSLVTSEDSETKWLQ